MKKALLIYSVDREDGGHIGFTAALPIPETIDNFQDAINHLMPKLTNREFLDRLILEDCLGDVERYDLPVKCVYYGWSLKYEFYVNDRHKLTFTKELAFIHLEDS